MLELKPGNANIRYNLALHYLKENRYWLTAQELIKVIKLNPNDCDAYYNLAVLNEIYFYDNNTAIEYYKKYLALSPNANDKEIVEIWIRQLKNKK